MTGMQFGIFTVGDVTPDPTTGRTPPEAERIRAPYHREEGRGGRPGCLRDRRAPQPAVYSFVPDYSVGLHRCADPAPDPVDVDDADHHRRPVKIAEDFSVLQHLSGGRVDLMLGRGNTGPVYPWFGKDIRMRCR